MLGATRLAAEANSHVCYSCHFISLPHHHERTPPRGIGGFWIGHMDALVACGLGFPRWTLSRNTPFESSFPTPIFLFNDRLWLMHARCISHKEY